MKKVINKQIEQEIVARYRFLMKMKRDSDRLAVIKEKVEMSDEAGWIKNLMEVNQEMRRMLEKQIEKLKVFSASRFSAELDEV